ncbi:MAG TPA: hypothetical protein VLG39_03960, partial [Nitrospirota bacterium]|nr:hypothetical protein [Nitrospirota bacterium]
MLLGYMTLVALTLIVVAYALYNLQRINNLNRDIVKVDVLVQEASGKMLDALFAQDTYEKRFLILKSPDAQDLFLQREGEFRTWLDAIKQLPDRTEPSTSTIETLYAKYTDLVYREFDLLLAGDIPNASALSNQEVKMVLGKLLDTLKSLSAGAKESQERKMGQISAIGGKAFLTTALLCLFSILIGAVSVLVVTHHISS